MNVFYTCSGSRADVPGDAPVFVTLEDALVIFRALDQSSGFMGVNLDERFAVQFAPQSREGVRVELLDTSHTAIDACVADSHFAESLIRAAAAGQDVFQMARGSKYEWEHTDMA